MRCGKLDSSIEIEKYPKILTRDADATENLEYIDVAKGIGILLVVLGHNLQDLPLMTSWIYSFHMPLFFAISGFLDAYKNSNRFPIKSTNTFIYLFKVIDSHVAISNI